MNINIKLSFPAIINTDHELAAWKRTLL